MNSALNEDYDVHSLFTSVSVYVTKCTCWNVYLYLCHSVLFTLHASVHATINFILLSCHYLCHYRFMSLSVSLSVRIYIHVTMCP